MYAPLGDTNRHNSTNGLLLIGGVLGSLIFGSVLILMGDESDDTEYELSKSRVGDKRYVFMVKRSQMDASQKWSIHDENPPLSCRKAIAAAKDVIEKKLRLEDFDDWKWVPTRMGLEDFRGDIWYWQIKFEMYPRKGGTTGIPFSIESIVLMDGKAIDPMIEMVNPDDEDEDH